MVFAFFRGGSDDGNLEDIAAKSVAMLSDARHSFDLATLAVLTDASAESVADDIRATDHRINLAEQELRSELVVHVSVRGSADIGSVLGFTLLIKKIERIGDQAKNILELAEQGVSLAHRADIETLRDERQVISSLFAEAGDLLSSSDPDTDELDDFSTRCRDLTGHHKRVAEQCLTSDLPGREVVPLAIYYRYLRRIVANLLGIVRASVDPLPHLDYQDSNTDDPDE